MRLRLYRLAPILIGLTVCAQTRFEVASVKVSSDGPRGGSFSMNRGVLNARNVVLKLLISTAYGVQGFQIEGLPSGMNDARFDVEAKAGREATREEMIPMLRALLEERFGLRARREEKEGAIFTLTVAKGGPKFGPLKDGVCPSPDPKAPCGIIRTGANGLNRVMDSTGSGIAIWARTLTLILARPVIDGTSLTGQYGAMRLEYAPDDRADADGPSIFTALPEQLGLRLEAGASPVSLLMIEHIEMPGPN